MQKITSIAEMQQKIVNIKRSGKRVAFVPTMGYLHQGHVSLLEEGRKRGDLLLLSIFVNPTQFGLNEDLGSYPRDMERDIAIAERCGVDILFVPEAVDMYPPKFQTAVKLGALTKPLCGASRQGHFDGVATVVTKLFNIVQPDTALFGKKDFQQFAVIRQMVLDLNLPVEIIGMPIVREADGLAMSSRNSYLDSKERQSAVVLYRSIRVVLDVYASGERNIEKLHAAAMQVIKSEKASEIEIEYLEFRDSKTLELAEIANDETLFALAARVGKTRVIDNTLLGEENLK